MELAATTSLTEASWQRRVVRRLLPVALLIPLAASRAFAFSEIQREDLPPPPPQEEESGFPEPPPARTITPVPLPDPIVPPRSSRPTDAPDEAAPSSGEEPLPEIRYGEDGLPEPVARMRRLIMEACLTGEVENLRPLLGLGDNATQLTFGGGAVDPVALLRDLSGDGEGQEIMAILYEVLDAGYAHIDAGTDEELYVWPYFFAIPLDSLDSRQRVELFKIVTAGDYEDMKVYGAYIFYRVGITPDGRWQFFIAGD